MAEGPVNLNWDPIMKHINESPYEFFQGSWTFLCSTTQGVEVCTSSVLRTRISLMPPSSHRAKHPMLQIQIQSLWPNQTNWRSPLAAPGRATSLTPLLNPSSISSYIAQEKQLAATLECTRLVQISSKYIVSLETQCLLLNSGDATGLPTEWWTFAATAPLLPSLPGARQRYSIPMQHIVLPQCTQLSGTLSAWHGRRREVRAEYTVYFVLASPIYK